MSRSVVRLAVLVTLVVAAFTPTRAQQRPPFGPQTVTLTCRMGGTMSSSVVTQFNLITTQLDGKPARVPVSAGAIAQLTFTRATAAVQATGANLAAGSCGWSDRAMDANDPAMVVENIDAFGINATVLWGNGSTLRADTTLSGGHLSFQNGNVFSMQVTRPASPQLQVVAGTTPKLVSAK